MKFKEPDNTAVFTTKFVVVDKKDITIVYHEIDDGAWQFFSNDHFDDFEQVAMIVGLGELLKIDKSLLELADMQRGYYARREAKDTPWTVEIRQ
ncbi:MAG TPA: hypothetical protein VG101_06500 [Puia sp.]|nr:hypothetical protein [Puia sp.]